MIRTTNSCCGNEAGLVEKFIGTAYDVVKTVYDNLGELQFIYDFLNKYGVLITVSSVQELQALPTIAKYTRVYSTSTAGERIYTDYLYLDGDRTGVLPSDLTATGSWVVVGTSTSGGSDASGGYIPFVYNKGLALGGETTITVPDGTVGVPFIIVNGYTNYVGKGFTYSVADLEVTLAKPLETGDEVVLLLTGVPAVPDNPNVDNWTVINWLYNQGAAAGGEQVIQIPYTFQDIPAVYKNGLRFYKGLTTNSYIIDADNQRIILTEVLATNDRLIVQIGGELVTLEVSDRTLEEVARSANVKDSEVILSTNTTSTLNDKTVVYDVLAQKSYGLSTLPTNVYISSVSNGQLTYQPGNVTVSLLPLPLEKAFNDYKDLIAGPDGSAEVGFKLTPIATVVRKVIDKITELISVKDFGAKGDGVTDDSDAIQAAIIYAESLPQVLTYPYTPVTVWFSAGSYRHTKPIRVTQPIILDGEGVEIKALAPFTGITVPLQAGGTEEFKGQLYVVHGNKGADSSKGQLRGGFTVSKGILLSANDTAMSNIYMERFVNARINSALQDSPTDGLVIGPSCWGLSTHALSIENFNRYAIHFLDKAAVNGAVLDVRIWGNFKTGQAGILFDVGSQCNGLTITGYIEKVDYGIIAARSTGAVLVSGVDFEQCTNRVLQASSDGSDGLTIGRITFKNCYLHSVGAAKIFAQHTVVSVEGCTMHAATADFETDANSTGFIYADNNDYLVGYVSVIPGSNVDVKFNKALVRDNRVYQPVKSTSFANVPLINLYQYKDAPSLLSSTFNFQSRWNNTDSKYEQESTWKVSDYYPGTSLQRECGLTLTTVGSFGVRPIVDNFINAGLPTYRFTAVYSVNGTIQTSDARHKNIRSIEEKELAVGTALAPLMIAFTWKNGEDHKTHFGCSAQKVIEIFKDHGLNAEDYGIVEYSEEADIYSVNYSELLALCIAALASKLK